MERLLIIRRKVSNPVDVNGQSINLEFYEQDVVPIRFVRGLRLRIDREPQGSNNLIKNLLIFLEFNGSNVGGETPGEVVALGRLITIDQGYIKNFFDYFDKVVQKLSAESSSPVEELTYKEDEDFKPQPEPQPE